MSSIHDPRYKALVAKLIEIRKAAGVSQVELAQRLNKKHQSAIAKVETFERRLDVIELLDWLAALEYDLARLADDLGWTNKTPGGTAE